MHTDLGNLLGRLLGRTTLILLLLGLFNQWVGTLAVAVAYSGADSGAHSGAQSEPNDPTDTVVTDCSNDAQLRAALVGSGPSIVTFDCGTGDHSIPLSTYLPINGTFAIDGGGNVLLDGNDAYALLQISATSNLTLRNMGLVRGIFNGQHPIENFGNLTLINVSVLNNKSTGTGGAIYNGPNATLNVRDSFFRDNTSPTSATITHGAAIYSEGSATVQDSDFSQNRVEGSFGSGGAIAVFAGHFTVEDSHFSNNGAHDGGALFVESATVVTVTNSTFDMNVADYGGAIETEGELQVDYSTFTSNEASTGDGGAIWVLGSDLDLTYSTFISNTANTTGGAISCYDNNVSIIHSTFTGNSADNEGGALYSTCDVNLSNSTFYENRSSIEGGAIKLSGDANATLNYVTVSHNRAPLGGGFFNDSAAASVLTLRSSVVADNSPINCVGDDINSDGYNFSSDNTCANFVQTGDRQSVALPLGPLQNNGGPTLTRMLLPPNPAINAVPSGMCGFSVDQRDVARPQGGACDSGAVEVLYANFIPALHK